MQYFVLSLILAIGFLGTFLIAGMMSLKIPAI